ncbi:SSI family serine proteinase inhibitor [Blastococcus saxobsidens]|uniref:Protease inhibitor n=1 Tax=Blastococcus saxobsidens (strain DD2) TaxID=1146883 RepID=H6RVL3_BLASD|nr:SSI family serine proteinase inhibitor [Blastococcus saxobsidens]CCG03288.1 Protease inhibitor [Blastococcus saxobsidens DD2]
MRRLLPLLLFASAVVLGGCASADPEPDGTGGAVAGSGGAVPDTGSGSGISQAENDLRIEVDLGDGVAPQTWTLTCVGSVEGTHPRAADACAHLDGMTEPFAPLPEDLVCTEQYGGPQTAHITGRWRGEPVDLELSRVDGCRISQWDSFGPVLPVPVGVEPLG